MNRRTFALALLAGAAFAPPVAALDPHRRPSQYVHDAWTELDGLPQNSVRAIAETPDGFLWIGTEEGLVRFDGATFRLFDRAATTGRAGNEVTALATTTDGVLFVLTRKDGLCRFADALRFQCTPLPEGAEGSVIVAIENDVLVASDHGLFRLAGGAMNRVAGLGPIRDLARTSGGALLVATGDRGLVEIRGDAARDVALPPEIAKEDVFNVAAARAGGAWVGTRRGLYTMQGGSVAVVSGADRPTGRVRFVREDEDANVFVSIDDDAVYRFANGRYARIPLSATQPVERAGAFFADDEGNVWIGSLLSGLHRLRDGAAIPWGKEEGVEQGYVSATLATKDGVIWLGSPHGLYGIAGDDVVHLGTKEGLPSDVVRGMTIAKDGSIYAGTHSGLARILSVSPPRAERVAAAGDRDVNAIDDAGDALILGTRTGLVDLASGRTYGVADGLPSAWIAELHRSKDKTLWIATDQGLGRLRPNATRIEIAFPDVFGHTAVTSFFDEDDVTMLVGTSDAGLVRIRGEEARALRARDGLYDETTFAIVDDTSGFLWMTCNKGISRVARREVDAFFDGRAARISPRAFGRSDGMRSRECNGGTPGAARDPAGRLWFPTMLGAVAIDPRALHEGAPPRTPIIDGARVAGVLTTRPDRVVLPSHARSVDVVFAVPALAGGVVLETRLDGHGDLWQPIAGRTATYASLGPGVHRLEVRARDALGRTSASAASLVIDVPPRTTETLWFRVLLGALGAGFVLALGLFRVRAIEARRRRLAELVDERTRELATRNADLEERTRELAQAIADLKRAETDLVRAEKMASVATLVSGIAHELNNPLTFLAGNLAPLRTYTEFLLRSIREVGAGEKALGDVRLGARKDLAFVETDLAKLLSDMDEGGRRARLIVGDLQNLTSARSRAIEPVDLARVALQTVRLLAPRTKSGVTIETDLGKHAPILARAGEIEQAVVNLIDNALRAIGDEGTVRVRVFEEDGAGVIEVVDDGPGMSDDVKRRATEPFFTTRAAGEGSGLGLAIVATIAEHHRGSLAIDSAPGKGTRVRLTVRNATAPSG